LRAAGIVFPKNPEAAGDRDEQHRDGCHPDQNVPLCASRCDWRRHLGAVCFGDGESADGLRDVLETPFPQQAELQRQLVLDLIVNAPRDAHSARFGHGLDARRDIDAITQEVLALDDDVPKIHANAEPHALILGQMLVAGADRRLDFGRAADRFHCAREFGQDRIAGSIENAAPMLREKSVKDFPVPSQDLHRSLLVLAHHPAVSRHISHHDRCQATLQRGLPGLTHGDVVVHLYSSSASWQ